MHPRSSAGTSRVDNPAVDADGVRFMLADPHRRLAGVRFVPELDLDAAVAFTRAGSGWRLHLRRPPVDRMEYLLEVQDHNGNRSTINDPANPLRAPGAFGDKSVVQFPGYAEPAWLSAPGVAGVEEPFAVDARGLASAVEGVVWSPASLAADTPAPLLIVHDGPEFAALAGFTTYLAVCIAAGAVPPLRAVLLDPGDRNSWYAANPGYARALVDHVLPEIARRAPSTVRIGAGASLGALAMLHVQRSHPGTLDALLLQSGSFFTTDLDAQESQFAGFGAVTEFVDSLHSAGIDKHPVPIAMTCGTAEENLANNRRMATTLRRLGYPAQLTEVRDAHNFTAWRDALHPQLTELITTLAATRAA